MRPPRHRTAILVLVQGGTMREAGKRCGLKDSAAMNLRRRIANDLIEFFGLDVIRRLLVGLRPGWESDLRHKLPEEFRRAIESNATAKVLWSEITPLARNEWICWVTSAKQDATRQRRIVVGIDKMQGGMRRPCYWPGYPNKATQSDSRMTRLDVGRGLQTKDSMNENREKLRTGVLQEGKYYLHTGLLYVRHIDRIDGKNVYWTDRFGSGR